jgi:transcriptional regulator with XRE-family HTH domain
MQEITALVDGPPQILAETNEVLLTIGGNIRRLRMQRGLTLQALATATRLSSSMLSLLERGKTGPSIGTLVAIASALDSQMLDLLGGPRDEDRPVSRRDKQLVYSTAQGVQRRVLKNDALNEVEIAINEYEPGTASAAQPVAHKGYEFGIVLEGELQITLNEQAYVLAPGDLISYRSTDPHRIANPTKRRAKALWVNMRGR